MENINNDEVKKMLDMLKEQAENTQTTNQIDAQTTEGADHSEDDIKNMLKKHFSAEPTEAFDMGEDYSYDTEDFSSTGEIEVLKETITEEACSEEVDEIEEIVAENIEENESDFVEENHDQIEEVLQEILEEAEEIVQETVEEIAEINEIEEVVEEIAETAEVLEEATMPFVPVEEISEATNVFEAVIEEKSSQEPLVEPSSSGVNEQIFVQEVVEEQIAIEEQITINEIEIENSKEDEMLSGPLSEESINYDDVLEGQQGTVFNNFVEDFTGDLDDVVFEAEITDSHAPAKQYTIFEDWEQLMRDKQYETAEEGIIPPTKEELAYSAEIAARAARAHTDYFTPIEGDASNTGVMGENAHTGGFEKIRQEVNSSNDNINTDKTIYGYCGEEYKSLLQSGKIKKKFKNDKNKLIFKTISTAIIALILVCYEFGTWMNMGANGVFGINNQSNEHIFIGLELLLLALAISGSKLKTFFKNMLSFSSISYIGAIILTLVSVLYDVLIMSVGYANQGVTVHSFAAFLLLLSLIYDLFDLCQQSGVFDIITRNNKKFVLEPYGKLKLDESEDGDEIIDKDSYCISRVSNVNGFFARTSKAPKNVTNKLVTLVVCFAVSLVVMLTLLITGEQIGTIVLGLVVTLSFSFICASIFEGEFAFFTVYKILKKYKTGIIGKASVEEYGKSNIVYFDDFNVFNKKSVRTKGLKLYDNNEIYRILYHTQAVFSKVGGPLKGVFEFATTEMLHSKNVEIKEICKDGIAAIVDNRTSVLIGTGSFMKLRGIHPSYTAADLRLEEAGEDSILFIALGGSLGAKLYVTYQFSGEFEKLAKKMTACGINIGIRSADPNINERWAKTYGAAKKCSISIIRPNLTELKPRDKSVDAGLVSIKNVRAISEAVMMCNRLNAFEPIIAKIRIASIILMGILNLTLVMVSGINTVSMLLLMLTCALFASVMMLLSHFYIKR